MITSADVTKLEELGDIGGGMLLGVGQDADDGPRGPSAAGADFGMAGDRATKTAIAG